MVCCRLYVESYQLSISFSSFRREFCCDSGSQSECVLYLIYMQLFSFECVWKRERECMTGKIPIGQSKRGIDIFAYEISWVFCFGLLWHTFCTDPAWDVACSLETLCKPCFHVTRSRSLIAKRSTWKDRENLSDRTIFNGDKRYSNHLHMVCICVVCFRVY